MCMTTVDTSFKWDGKEMVGYKIFFQEKDGGFSPPCFPRGGDYTKNLVGLREGDVIRDLTNDKIADETWLDNYLLGFHFFATREAARDCKRDMQTWSRFSRGGGGERNGRKFVIVKCRFSDVRSKGTQTFPAEADIEKRTKSHVTYTAGRMQILSVVR